MAEDNCATDDTHAPARTRRKPTHTGAPPPARPRAGSLVEVTLVSGPRLGIVMEAEGGGKWELQWLDILFKDGVRLLVRSPNVRIINRRRRKPNPCKPEAGVVSKKGKGGKHGDDSKG